MKTTVLVDGKWVAYKMYFSHRQLQTSDGKPTGMVHGFMQDLLRIHKKLPEASIIICWDGAPPTWRHKVYPLYKANRPMNPEANRMQESIAILFPLLRRLGFRLLRQDEVEADDMIGMVARRLASEQHHVRVYSSDQDMLQLANEFTGIWRSLEDKPLNEKDVKKLMGVEPYFVSEVRAMAGDASDNLKGLSGVGLKTAIKLWHSGVRPTAPLPKLLAQKYKDEWPRVCQEFRLALIIDSPDSPVWTPNLRKILTCLLEEVAERPGRWKEKAERNREEVYRLMARYELEQLLAERHILFNMP